MADSFVTLVGNITRDPELRFTNNGRALATFGIAVSRRYQVRDEWQEQTSFFNVTAWAQLGENVAQSLGKGARVIVTGRLEQREYETREGEKRTAVDIVADEVGPSLRWATAQVEKTSRQSADGGTPDRGAAASGDSGSRSAGSGSSYGDEEPF
ncbi:MAG: single-stranded DNA-binding protein [Acidimicrobiia bacterium]